MSEQQKASQAIVSSAAKINENQIIEKVGLFLEDGTNLVDALGGGVSGGGSNEEVYFALQLVPIEVLEANEVVVTPGVSIVTNQNYGELPDGVRLVVTYGDESYESFIGDGSYTAISEDPQLSTFKATAASTQSALLNVAYDVTGDELLMNTTYLIFGDGLVPANSGGSGGAGGSNNVYFAMSLASREFLESVGAIVNPGVSLVLSEDEQIPEGGRTVVVYDDGSYESFIGDGTETVLSEVPQLSTFQNTTVGGQSVMLNVFYDALSGKANTLYLMFNDNLILLGDTTTPEVVEVYFLITAAKMEEYLGGVVTGTEITFPEAPPGVFRMLVEGDPGVWTSFTTDGTTVAPVDTEQIIGSAAKFVFAANDVFATDDLSGGWSVYAINTAGEPDRLIAVGGSAARQNGAVLYVDPLFSADALTVLGATYSVGVSIEFPLPVSERVYVHNEPYIDVYQGDGTAIAPYVGKLGGSDPMPAPDLVVAKLDYTGPAGGPTLWVKHSAGDSFAPYASFPRSVYSDVKTDDYTVTGRDFGGVIEMDAATVKTITFPSGGTYGFPQLALGVFVEFYNAGSANLTIDHDANIEFSVGGSTVSTVTVAPGGSVKARCRVFDSTSEFVFTGDTAP